MLHTFLPEEYASVCAFVGILAAFFITIILIEKCSHLLPKDAGREFAHNGKKSAGKPRGAGLIFVMVFIGTAVFFMPIKAENIIYLILLFIRS